MKDIDFDELDRAVSSVLGNSTPKKDDVTLNASTTDAVDNDSDGVVDQPMSFSVPVSNSISSDNATTQAVVEPSQAPLPSRAVPLAIKRRGKFMDVVHPSSDMNPSPSLSTRRSVTPLETETEEQKAEESEVPQTPIEEEAPEIKLLPAEAESDEIDDAADTSEVSEPQSEAPNAMSNSLDEPVAPAEMLTPNAQGSNILDSLASDTDGLENEVEAEKTNSEDPVSQSTTEPQDSPQDDANNEDTPSTLSGSFGTNDSGPTETPFITDAKVEKRPLGGFGEESSEDSGPAGSFDMSTSTAQTPPPMSLTRELQSDVVQVEAIQDDTKAPAEPMNSASAPTLSTTVPETDDNDSNTHSLFDTSSYHEPIAHEKKSSVPAWVWWLVGLLLCLAAGAGVGYFLFVTGL